MKTLQMKTSLAVAAAGILATLGLAASGCSNSDAGCDSSVECRGSRVCVSGQCVTPPNSSDAESDTSADTGVPLDTSEPDGGEEPDTNLLPDVPTPEDATMEDVPPQPDTVVPPDTTTPPDTSPDTRTFPDTGPLGPQIKLIPANEIDFGTTVVGATTSQKLRVRNTGDGPLKISKVEISPMSQSLSMSGPSSPTIGPGKEVSYTVTFAPNSMGGLQRGTALTVDSNDADPADQTKRIEIDGAAFNKVRNPCLFSTPDSIDYGVVKPGGSATHTVTIGNCSQNSSVTVTNYQWLENETSAFSVTSSSPSPPFTLQANQSKQIDIKFTSSSLRSLEGRLLIRSDELVGGPDVVDLKASGGGCPEAVAQGEVRNESHDYVREGPIPVPVGQTAELSGNDSSAPSGMVNYTWSLASKPSGSNDTLSHMSSSTTRLKPTTSGVYEAKLTVTDAKTGQAGCVDDTIEVLALKNKPEAVFYATWKADHDMDVHVLRSDTQGNFPAFGFNKDDVFPDRRTRDWGQANNRLDDAFHLGDGAGGQGKNTEKVWITTVEQNRDYRFAVHFEDASGFRPRQFSQEAFLVVGNKMQKLSTQTTIRDRNEYWITFDLDGANKTITKVDRNQ